MASTQPVYPPAGSAPSGFEIASAPPASFDTIDGYENTVGFNSVIMGPPQSYFPDGQPTETPKETYSSSAFLTDAEAKMALIEFVGQHCCYGKSPAVDIKVKHIVSSSAYHYSLDTFHETRETNWHQEPYKGQAIDGPMYGIPPGPWNVFVAPPALFTDQVSHAEVPHTASVKGCWDCHEKGKVKCDHCHGHGHERCPSCNGEGCVMREDCRKQCLSCNGRGKRDCHYCHGHGHIKCKKCDGGGQVKAFIRLTVKRKTHKGNHVLERSALPDHLIENVEGDILFSQEYPRVFPLTSFPEQEINTASQTMINSHAEELKFSCILMQRQRLKAVPVTEVVGEWKEKDYHYWVYSKEHKVHCPDYPQKCCWGCVIL